MTKVGNYTMQTFVQLCRAVAMECQAKHQPRSIPTGIVTASDYKH